MTRRRPNWKECALLAVLALAAVGVHGYHPATEDAERYTPGILKILHPSLYPRNAEFFESHAGMTLFPQIVAASIRATRAPVGAALLGWHLLSVFVLLLACWRIARLCFPDGPAVWCGVAMVGALLTIPVAGTALYIMDPYVTTRSLSTPLSLLVVASALEERYRESAVWALLTAMVHPLMVLFPAAYVTLFVWLKQRPAPSTQAAMAAAWPATLFPPVTPEYREVLQYYPYFFLAQWQWYEWLGLIAPFAIVAWFERLARTYRFGPMALACRALLLFGALFFAAALAVAAHGRFENYAELQPLRYLHLLYILMFLFMGGLLGTFALRRRAWRWALLFVPLCAGMAFAQQQTMPATPHLELPGLRPRNEWVEAFEWIRDHTPESAYFALDPDFMVLPGEDEHGFRAIAERSRLADIMNDSGAASMFPGLSAEWEAQVTALHGWKSFGRDDFERLKKQYGVDWVVVDRSSAADLPCPFASGTLRVCRID